MQFVVMIKSIESIIVLFMFLEIMTYLLLIKSIFFMSTLHESTKKQESFTDSLLLIKNKNELIVCLEIKL